MIRQATSRLPSRVLLGLNGLLSNSLPAKIAFAFLVIITIAGFASPLIAPQNPFDLSQIDFMDARIPPGGEGWNGQVYLFGTDGQGRDMLSAMLYGIRISLIVGIVTTLAAIFIGGTVGLVAAYFSGRVDAILMRVVDVQLSFPGILIALVILTAFGQGLEKVIIAIIAVQWAYFARTVRGSAMREMSRDYISASRNLEMSHLHIMFRQLLPNCLNAILVISGIKIAQSILMEATLSFLGLGLPITQPSLGLLISQGFSEMLTGAYWISVFPGILLLLTILSINLVADQLE